MKFTMQTTSCTPSAPLSFWRPWGAPRHHEHVIALGVFKAHCKISQFILRMEHSGTCDTTKGTGRQALSHIWWKLLWAHTLCRYLLPCPCIISQAPILNTGWLLEITLPTHSLNDRSVLTSTPKTEGNSLFPEAAWHLLQGHKPPVSTRPPKVRS